MKEDYNFMADILYLPKDKNGYAFLLVVVDLATDDFDIEPIKATLPKGSKVVKRDSLTAQSALDAMLRMFKRKFIKKKPYASIRTDGGSEFASVFDKYCYDNSILHRVGEREDIDKVPM